MRSLCVDDVLTASLESGGPCVSAYAHRYEGLLESLERARVVARASGDGRAAEEALRSLASRLGPEGASSWTYPVAVFSSRGLEGRIERFDGGADFAIAAGSFHVKPLLKRRQAEGGADPREIESKAVSEFLEAAKHGRGSRALHEIVRMAFAGQVRHLLVSEGVKVWGRLDREAGGFRYASSAEESGDDDVLDDLAEAVYRSGGRVTVVESSRMPKGAAACAVVERGAKRALRASTSRRDATVAGRGFSRRAFGG